jgi:hypothetical protein
MDITDLLFLETRDTKSRSRGHPDGLSSKGGIEPPAGTGPKKP